MQWILACDSHETCQAVSTAISNSGSGATLQRCASTDAASQVAQRQPDLVLLASDESIESQLPWIREIVEVAGCDVLLIGHASNARIVLQVLDAGVSRFVDRDELEVSLPAALQALAKQPGKPTSRGHIICVAGAGSGSGASTVVANLAVAMNHSPAGAIAVDLRLEAGDLASLLDVQARYSIANFCDLQDRMDANMFDSCLATHQTGAQLLAAPPRLSEVAKVTPRGVRRALCMARQRSSYVIVDLGQPHRPEHAQALYLAETVLIVMCLDFTALRKTQGMLDYLEQLNIPRERVKLVVNRRGRPGELRVAEIQSALGMTATFLLPEDRRRILSANNQGTPVVEMKPRCRISRSLFEVARSINGFVDH
jgi:pilus assembly protein CpaE